MRPTTALRALLKGDETVVAPGVYDGLSARLARDAGFAAIYATGGGIARSMGYPDLGLLSMQEVTERVAGIVEHAGVPDLIRELLRTLSEQRPTPVEPYG